MTSEQVSTADHDGVREVDGLGERLGALARLNKVQIASLDHVLHRTAQVTTP